MNVEEIRSYCLSKEGVIESFPFNDTALVFKVGGKMFALLDLSEDKNGISLKCEPSYAVELRERYPEISEAYHFNKKHWNNVKLDGNLGATLIMGLIDHSYQITAPKPPKKKEKEPPEPGQ